MPALPHDTMFHSSGSAEFEEDPSSETESDISEIIINVNEHGKQQCSIQNWYQSFKSHTIKTRFIDLSDPIIEYLLADSIQIPDTILPIHHNNDISDIDSDHQQHIQVVSDGDSDNCGSANLSTLLHPLTQQINQCLSQLNNKVCPQVNDCIPSDAVWISTEKTLKCQSAGDILLLLKSSDKIADELSNQSAYKHRHQLVLRQWSELHPARLYRCFVKEKQLIAISQTDTEYHEYLSDITVQSHMRTLIQQFFNDIIQPQFDSHNYVFDIYIDQNERTWLINFKLWSTNTSSYLYSWNELSEFDVQQHHGMAVECRLVERSGQNYYDVSMRSTAQKIISRMPHIDNIDLSDSAAIERFATAASNGHM